MSVIRVLFLFTALICIISARLPTYDENEATNVDRHKGRDNPNRKSIVTILQNAPKKRQTKHDKAPRINTRPELGVKTSVSPLTKTLATKMPPYLFQILKQMKMLPSHIGDNYVYAQKSSTTPDTYLDTDDQAGRMELEGAMSSLDDPVENEPKSIDNSTSGQEMDYDGLFRTKLRYIGIDSSGTAKFAAKKNTRGLYLYDNVGDENMTEFWAVEQKYLKGGKHFSRIHLKKNRDPKSNGLTSDELGNRRAALALVRIVLPMSLADKLNRIEIQFEDDPQTAIHESSTKKMEYPGRVTKYYENDNENESFFSLAIFASLCATLAMVIIVLIFGLSALRRQARAAAEVDYPAYGVTGPNVATDDRRLTHTAQIYHYEHHKQQITLGNIGMETPAESVSDNELEHDNAEGDYTVYECPGLATTGNMIVENPMFNDEPTPDVSDVASETKE